MTDMIVERGVHVEKKEARRAVMRAELEVTRAAFHALVQSFGGPAWHQKSMTTEWTFGEVLVHLTWALEQLPQEVENARRNQGMFNYPKWLANPLSYWYGRWLARGTTPDEVRRRYDRAMDATLIKLDTIQSDEWSRGADFYGEGFHSIEDLFHAPAKHLADHTTGWPTR
jgi:hypothetical protein